MDDVAHKRINYLIDLGNKRKWSTATYNSQMSVKWFHCINQSGLALAFISCIHVLGCQNKHEMSNVGWDRQDVKIWILVMWYWLSECRMSLFGRRAGSTKQQDWPSIYSMRWTTAAWAIGSQSSNGKTKMQDFKCFFPVYAIDKPSIFSLNNART